MKFNILDFIFAFFVLCLGFGVFIEFMSILEEIPDKFNSNELKQIKELKQKTEIIEKKLEEQNKLLKLNKECK